MQTDPLQCGGAISNADAITYQQRHWMGECCVSLRMLAGDSAASCGISVCACMYTSTISRSSSQCICLSIQRIPRRPSIPAYPDSRAPCVEATPFPTKANDFASQTQLIRTDAIATSIPLHHTQLVVLVLPLSSPPTNEPSRTLHFTESAFGTAVAAPSRLSRTIRPRSRLLRSWIAGLRLVRRSIHRQSG